MAKVKKNKVSIVAPALMENKILMVRGKKVILDRDLAELYGVETKALNRAVKRNVERFPEDFMFQLDQTEFENWRYQFGTSNSVKMGVRRPPYAFTEHGILMLSSVLNSERAIQVNILIMRTFVKLREMIATDKDLRRKIKALEKKHKEHEDKFEMVISAISELMEPPAKPRRKIGFKPS